MGNKRSGRCVKTQFDREILCAGTMTDYLQIYSRAIKGTEPGKEIQPGEDFTLQDDFAGYIEAKKDTPRWSGVSTEDQSANNFTHAGYIPFDQDIYELDVNRFFVKKPGTRDRYFKLKGITNYGEQDEYLQLKLAETGFTDLKASEG